MLPTKWDTCILILIFMLFALSDAAYSPTEAERFNFEEAHLPVRTYSSEKSEHGELNERMMYTLDLHTVSHAVNGTLEFCVANTNADQGALLAGLRWACGPGGANCSAIQPGQPCYNANNLAAIASYAYNDYFQRTQANGGTCNFNNTATLTPNDPSSGSCIFTGSSGNSSNTGGSGGSGSTNTNSSSGGNIIPNTNPSFGPSGLENSAYKLQFLSPIYLVVPVILFFCFKV